MGKIYFLIIYVLVVFCGGCAVTEMISGTVSFLGVLLIGAGIGLLVYTMRLLR
jgi:hypothetical protein